MPNALINYAAPGIPVLLISGFFGPAAAGFYSLGRKVLSMTKSLIGRSVSKVFYPHMADVANRGKNISRPHRKATAALALVGIIPFGSVFIAGPWLFAFVFGEDWIKAGEYARWIALWTYMTFISNPSNLTLVVFSLQKVVLLFEVIQIGLLVCGLCMGFYMFANDVTAIMLFCIMDSLLCLGLIIFAFIKVRQWEMRKTQTEQKAAEETMPQ
jgi:O-antigen/teichoic acid export membrane protein